MPRRQSPTVVELEQKTYRCEGYIYRGHMMGVCGKWAKYEVNGTPYCGHHANREVRDHLKWLDEENK